MKKQVETMLDQELEYRFMQARRSQAKFLARRTTIGTKKKRDPAELLERVKRERAEAARRKEVRPDQEELESLAAIEFSLLLADEGNPLPTINNRQFQQILKQPCVIDELSFLLRESLSE